MKALTLWQPWAWLIAAGAKHYETRSWATNYRGLLAIHAAKRFTNAEVAAFNDFRLRFPAELHSYREPMALGAMLCIVKLTAIYHTEDVLPNLASSEKAFGNYAPGRAAWKLELIEVFPDPIPAKGAQGLWNWERSA